MVSQSLVTLGTGRYSVSSVAGASASGSSFSVGFGSGFGLNGPITIPQPSSFERPLTSFEPTY
jgi:hypothetical protein